MTQQASPSDNKGQTSTATTARLDQLIVRLLEVLRADLNQRGTTFTAGAAEAFAAGVLDVLRKNLWAEAQKNPQDYNLGPCLSCIEKFMQAHPGFMADVAANAGWAKTTATSLNKQASSKNSPSLSPARSAGPGPVTGTAPTSPIASAPVAAPSVIHPLFRAIQAAADDVVPTLTTYVAQQGDVDLRDAQGNAAIHYVAMSGQHLLIAPLVTHHFPLSAVNRKGQTALHLSIANGQLATAEALLEQGINIHVIDDNGHSALMMAVIHGHAELITLLLEHGASLTALDNKQNTLLHLAAKYNRLNILQQLIMLMEASPPLDAVDYQGRSVLHLACNHNNPAMLRYLSQCGGNLRAKDKPVPPNASGLQPIEYACNLGYCDMVKAYLELDNSIPEGLEQRLATAETPQAQQILALFANHRDQQAIRSRIKAKAPIIRNLVLQGGGAKGLAYLGAVEQLFVDASDREAKHTAATAHPLYLNDVRRIAGTSAGAITAALLAVGNRHGEISRLLETTQFSSFLDGSHREAFLAAKTALQKENGMTFGNILKQLCSNPRCLHSLSKDMGLFSGEVFRTWIETQLQRATGITHITFLELHNLKEREPKRYKDLYVIASNLATSCAETFSHETTPQVIVSDAVRMSMSIPFLFVPHMPHHKNAGRREEIPGSALYIDGGVQDNFAVSLFDDYARRDDVPAVVRQAGGPAYNPQTLGLRLVDHSLKTKYEGKTPAPAAAATRPDGFVSLMLGTVNAFMNKQESDHERFSHDRARSVYIRAEASTFDFDITPQQSRSLIDAAKIAVLDFWQRVNQQQAPITLPKSLLSSIAVHCYSSQLLAQINSDGSFTIPSLPLQRQAPALVYEFHRHGAEELAIFKRLGISLHSIDPEGNTALHLAIRAVDVAAVDNLLSQKFNVNLPTKRGEYPLDLAWQVTPIPKRNRLVKNLLKTGATHCQPTTLKPLKKWLEEWLEQEDDPALERQLNKLRAHLLAQESAGPKPDEKHFLPPAFNGREQQRIRAMIETTPLAQPLKDDLDESQQLALLTTSSQEIIPGLYLGDYEAYREISRGKAGFIATIKVTAQDHNNPQQGFYYAPLPAGVIQEDIGVQLADSESDWPVLRSRLPKAFAAIDLGLQSKQKVLVYCSQGASRSVAVVIAYLCSRYGVRVDKAHNYVKTLRPQIDCQFLSGLKTMETELLQQYREANPLAGRSGLFSLAGQGLVPGASASSSVSSSSSSSSSSASSRPGPGQD